MSLFAVESNPSPPEPSSLSNKTHKFRLQIRRRQNDLKFKTIRKEFVASLKSLTFLEELKSEKDNLTAKQINWLVEGLEGGWNNANFYQDLMDMQLQPYLCQVLLSHDISLVNKTKIMNSLVELTYFSFAIPKYFLENSMIDFFRVHLKSAKFPDQLQEQFLINLSLLVLNLTSFKNMQFNEHMMQSDFLSIFYRILENSEASKEFLQKIRTTLLKIYKNIYMSCPQSMQSTANSLEKILTDEPNMQGEEILCCTLGCLAEAAKIPNFWLCLQNMTSENCEIYKEILTISYILVKNFTLHNFGLFIDFLNALYDQKENKVTDEVNYYYEQFPQDFFIICFNKLKQAEQTQESKKVLCKLVKLFSRLPSLKNIAYRTSLQRSQVVQTIMQRSILSSPITKKYLSRVLIKLLEEETCTIDLLIDNGIIDLVRDLLDCDYIEDQRIVDVIDLIEKLIESEEYLRDRTREQNKMLNVLYDRGIVRDVEKLQDQKCQAVYRRAEIFMSRLSQLSGK